MCYQYGGLEIRGVWVVQIRAASLSYGFESQSVDVSFQVRDLGGNEEKTDGKKTRCGGKGKQERGTGRYMGFEVNNGHETVIHILQYGDSQR